MLSLSVMGLSLSPLVAESGSFLLGGLSGALGLLVLLVVVLSGGESSLGGKSSLLLSDQFSSEGLLLSLSHGLTVSFCSLLSLLESSDDLILSGDSLLLVGVHLDDGILSVLKGLLGNRNRSLSRSPVFLSSFEEVMSLLDCSVSSFSGLNELGEDSLSSIDLPDHSQDSLSFPLTTPQWRTIKPEQVPLLADVLLMSVDGLQRLLESAIVGFVVGPSSASLVTTS